MERIKKLLLVCFYVPLAIVALCVVLCETDIIVPGCGYDNVLFQFHLLTLMELVTVALIPLALYLFRIKTVDRDLKAQPLIALRKWGLLRLGMLSVPMVLNTLLYYISLNVAYGYLAIILLICHVFVYPSRARCEQETSSERE